MFYSIQEYLVEKKSCEMLHKNTNTASIWPCHHCAVSLSRVGLCLSHNGVQTIAKVGTTFLRIQQRPKYLASSVKFGRTIMKIIYLPLCITVQKIEITAFFSTV